MLQTTVEEPVATGEDPVVLSAKDLGVIIHRSQPLISLPQYISEGLEAALEQSIGSSRRVRKSSQALTEKLKQLSRSTARGGTLELSLVEGAGRLQGTPRKVL